MLIGREPEKEILSKLLRSNQAEFVAIYGRRRVGKTYLVRQFFQEQIVFSFTGAFETETNIQINNFWVELKRVYPKAEFQKTPQNWSEAFHRLTDYLITLRENNTKIVIFIDELPWLDRTGAGFVSALEYFWNQHGSQFNNLIFVSCGSAASWMIGKLLKAKGGLHNRVTCRIELKPFSLKELKAFCEYKNLKFNYYQLTQIYMILGGIPYYWQAIEQGKSVAQVIENLCFDDNGILTEEFEYLYHSLFKNAEKHIKVIEALASHPYGLTRTQLLAASQISNGGNFVRVIENLVDCGFIKAFEPFGKKNKDTVYRIIDFYSVFYLRYIKGNIGDRSNTWQSLSKSAGYNSWMGYAFENICLTHLKPIHKALGISGVFTKTSSFYFKGNNELPGTQIDIVIERNDGIIHLCEAKFTNTEFILNKEINQSMRRKRLVFQEITKTKKMVVSTLFSTYPAIQNQYYNEEIHSEVILESLFE
jgi:uncharacterized protein